MKPTRDQSTLFCFSILLLTAFAAFWLNIYPYFIDDAFISLRYADRLLEGKGLTWNDGERVEGYSNLLWTLMVALPGAFGVDLLISAWLVNLCWVAAMFFAVARFGQRNGLHWTATAGGLAFITFNLPIITWTMAGLEAVSYAALMLLAVDEAVDWMVRRKPLALRWLGLWLGLIAISRPEGLIMTLPFLLALFYGEHFSRTRATARTLLEMAWIPVAFFTAQLIFRIVYYHDIFPNTYYAKVAFRSNRIEEGAAYVWTGLRQFWPVYAFLAFYVVQYPKRLMQWRPHFIAISLPAITWLLLVTIGGGDIFPGWRHLVPFLVLNAPLVALVMQGGCLKWPHQRGWLLFLCLAAILYSFVKVQKTDLYNPHRMDSERQWVRNCIEAGLWLREQFTAQQPRVAVTVGGAIPYYSKLPALDMFGLNDKNLTAVLPKNFGTGMIGHELLDVEYVLWRRPEIIIWHDGQDTDWFGYEEEALKWYYPKTIRLSNGTPFTFWFRIDFPDAEAR